MAVTTQLKTTINRYLYPVGVKIDSVTEQKQRQERLDHLTSLDYFRQPSFPIPKKITDARWQVVAEAVTNYREKIDQLQSVPNNDVSFTDANTFFHCPDADVLYAIVREFRPTRILEIGCGNSTRVSRQAIIDGGLSTRLIAVDPEPRTNVTGFANQIMRCNVESLPAEELATTLDKGDILFIDSSHTVNVGNDCVYEFLQLLPRIRSGVLVHIHDVSLPWDYPEHWIKKEPIVYQWSEQYLLQTMLQWSDAWEVIWPGYFLQQTVRDFDSWFPFRADRDAASFWMMRK